MIKITGINQLPVRRRQQDSVLHHPERRTVLLWTGPGSFFCVLRGNRKKDVLPAAPLACAKSPDGGRTGARGVIKSHETGFLQSTIFHNLTEKG